MRSLLVLLLVIGLSAMTVPLPPLTEWQAPADLPTAPGGSFAVQGTGTVTATAPIISGWSDTARPDEQFVLSGIRFTRRSGAAAGSDTAVWLWADNAAGGALHRCRIWQVEESLLTAAVPAGIGYGMYAVWVENDAGASAPVCLNRARPTWLGPLDATAAPGATKRLFGHNLAQHRGTAVSHVAAQPVAGGAWTFLAVTTVEPYAVAFTAPAAVGDYRVRLHSGHGGAYGWSEAFTLRVASPFQRGPTTIAVPAGGAIQPALTGFWSIAAGGTVQLAEGVYTISDTLQIPPGVRLRGAGQGRTIIRLEWAELAEVWGLACLGDDILIEDLTVRQARVGYGTRMIRQGDGTRRLTLRRVTLDAEAVPSVGEVHGLLPVQAEIDSCIFWRPIYASWADRCWIHHSTFHGSTHGDADAAIFSLGGTDRLVVEHCHFSTPAWPTGPDGRRDYLYFLPPEERGALHFCPRLYAGGGSFNHWAHNTSQDVAPGMDDRNKGEMILWHEGWTGLGVQAASSTGRTTTIRSDGRIAGAVPVIDGGNAPLSSLADGNVIGRWAVITAGTGRGQARQVAATNATSFTVAADWRIPPADDSVLVFTSLHRDNVVYRNELNAFPPGYRDHQGPYGPDSAVEFYSASCGVDLDGNGWHCAAEGNTSRRTFSGPSIHGRQTAPSYWNQYRDETALEIWKNGVVITDWSADGVIGSALLGNTVQNVAMTMQTSEQRLLAFGIEQTGVAVRGERCAGLVVAGVAMAGGNVGISLDSAATVVRGSSFSLAKAPDAVPGELPVYDGNRGPITLRAVTGAGPAQVLLGNSYQGHDVQDDHRGLFAPLRHARVGPGLASQDLAIASSAPQAVDWSIAGRSPAWVLASVLDGSNGAEGSDGLLRLGGDPAGLAAGVHWGSVTLTGSDGTSAHIGLRLVVGGGDSNAAPVVQAGPDRDIVLPAVAQLAGAVGDDGLPQGELSQHWSLVSGPGPVLFADPAVPATTASFTTAGGYVLRLAASDGQDTASDELTVTVTGTGVGPARDRRIRLALPAGHVWQLMAPADGGSDTPAGGQQEFLVHRTQTAVLEAAPAGGL